METSPSLAGHILVGRAPSHHPRTPHMAGALWRVRVLHLTEHSRWSHTSMPRGQRTHG